MPGPEGCMKEFDRLMGRVEERASLSESLTTREKKRPRRYCERCSRKGRRLISRRLVLRGSSSLGGRTRRNPWIFENAIETL